MKIQLFIMAFLLAMVPLQAQSYSIVKGSVYGVSNNLDAVGRANSSINGSEFGKGIQVHLTEGWGFKTLKERGRVHMFFSNKMHVWVGGKTTLWVDNFEQFVDKDEKGKQLADGGGFVANFRLHGSADFKLSKMTDEGYFSIMTNSADLEIRSKHFYIKTDGGQLTDVECYEGTIKFTNSRTLEETIMTAGNTASVYGKEGELNLSVRIFPLKDFQLESSKERITEEDSPEWKFSDKATKIP
jgi:hypothetical protein